MNALATEEPPAPGPSQGRPAPTALAWLGFSVLVVVGIWFRSPNIDSLPWLYHPALQYETAMGARQIWMNLAPGSFDEAHWEWYRDSPRGFTGPPILQFFMALNYWITGDEVYTWVGAINVALWIAGAFYIFKACRRLTKQDIPALVGAAAYLLAPEGVIASRSFQVESLMTLGFSFALDRILACDGSLRWADTAALTATVAAVNFIKPGVLFFPLLLAHLALVAERQGLWKSMRSAQPYAYVIGAVAPAVLYALVFLGEHPRGKFIPSLLLEGGYYQAWFASVGEGVGVGLAVAAVIGVVAEIAKGRLVVAALAAAYVLYSLLFSWHSMTHSYYQVPLIPVAACGISAAVSALVSPALSPLASDRVRTGGLLCAVGLAACFAWAGHKDWLIFRDLARMGDFKRNELDPLLRLVGDHYPPGTRAICLDAESGGLQLNFHCWLRTRNYPTLADAEHYFRQSHKHLNPAQVFEQMLKSHEPSCFVVVTLAELRVNPFLSRKLTEFRIVASSRQHIVVDLTKRN